MTATLTTGSDTERRDALADQIFQATLGANELMHVYLGDRLGLYTALAKVDDASSADLASRAGIAERYAREWLEQQAVAGVLDVTDDTGDARARRYRLSPGAAAVLCDPDSLYFLAPLASLAASVAQALPQVVEAFRTGGGVPFAAYGADIRDGIARANRPMFLHQLATEWIPALPDIEARLRRTDPAARVADLGCGSGWSAIALARGYPAARVDGIDLDEASIDAARSNAHAAGVADRVSLVCRDAADSGLADRYDLVTLFETLHDMAHPVQVLRAVRAMLSPGGTVLIADERVAETFTAPGDDLERFNYGWSALHCLAAALVEPGAAGTGTVIRPEMVKQYALDAGFTTVTVLPIEHDFWRFYRLDP
ncbi:MAG TPA: class I SAM-dependent methyltransferase [Pilimelia sp.]|nr:class I SAM-dependent methyltransferase [Pilimelia sp.]